MTMTIYDAMKLSRVAYTIAAFKEIATSDELFSVLPFVPKAGEGFGYTREKSLGSFNFVAPGHTSVGSSTGADERVTVSKAEAVEDFYIRNFAQDNLSDGISQIERETMRKFKAAGRTLASTVVGGGYVTGITMSDAFAGGAYVDALVAASPYTNSDRNGPGSLRYTNAGTFLAYRAPGDRTYGPNVACATDGNYTLYSDNPSQWVTLTLDVSDASADATREIVFTSSTNEFDGMATLCAPSQLRTSTGTSGDAPSLAILDELLDSLKVRDNMVFVMNASCKRRYAAVLRALGGENTTTLPNTSRGILAYNGVPILTNDNIPSTEAKGSSTTLTSIYCASLSADEGLYMGALGGDTFQVDADPRDATVLGFRLMELGQSQAGASSFGRRLAWYGALACGSNLALARASEIIV